MVSTAQAASEDKKSFEQFQYEVDSLLKYIFDINAIPSAKEFAVQLIEEYNDNKIDCSDQTSEEEQEISQRLMDVNSILQELPNSNFSLFRNVYTTYFEPTDDLKDLEKTYRELLTVWKPLCSLPGLWDEYYRWEKRLDFLFTKDTQRFVISERDDPALLNIVTKEFDRFKFRRDFNIKEFWQCEEWLHRLNLVKRDSRCHDDAQKLQISILTKVCKEFCKHSDSLYSIITENKTNLDFTYLKQLIDLHEGFDSINAVIVDVTVNESVKNQALASHQTNINLRQTYHEHFFNQLFQGDLKCEEFIKQAELIRQKSQFYAIDDSLRSYIDDIYRRALEKYFDLQLKAAKDKIEKKKFQSIVTQKEEMELLFEKSELLLSASLRCKPTYEPYLQALNLNLSTLAEWEAHLQQMLGDVQISEAQYYKAYHQFFGLEQSGVTEPGLQKEIKQFIYPQSAEFKKIKELEKIVLTRFKFINRKEGDYLKLLRAFNEFIDNTEENLDALAEAHRRFINDLGIFTEDEAKELLKRYQPVVELLIDLNTIQRSLNELSNVDTVKHDFSKSNQFLSKVKKLKEFKTRMTACPIFSAAIRQLIFQIDSLEKTKPVLFLEGPAVGLQKPKPFAGTQFSAGNHMTSLHRKTLERSEQVPSGLCISNTVECVAQSLKTQSVNFNYLKDEYSDGASTQLQVDLEVHPDQRDQSATFIVSNNSIDSKYIDNECVFNGMIAAAKTAFDEKKTLEVFFEPNSIKTTEDCLVIAQFFDDVGKKQEAGVIQIDLIKFEQLKQELQTIYDSFQSSPALVSSPATLSVTASA